MRRFATWTAALAVAAAGCGDGTGRGGITPTGPLFVGNTATVSVGCPSPIEKNSSGTCYAYGYDANGTFTNSNVSSWSSSNPSAATISSSGVISAVAAGSTTITAVIDGVSGSTGVTVVNPVPPPTVSITSGPGYARPGTRCEWLAEATGGTLPLTWSWSGGTPVIEDEGYYVAWTESSNFYVTVTVTDADGRSDSESLYVSVSTKAPACLL